MAITSLESSYSGASNGSADSLVALLGPGCNASPHVGLQVAAPALLVTAGSEDLVTGQKRSYGASFDGPTVEDGAEIDGDEDRDELSPGGSHSEKKRRLTFEQVRSLERNFEMENKLEPERKMQLAKELGLRPRQVAVWFQNRRARWKTKQLERDYETLAADYERLKADYEKILGEKKQLKAEVQRLAEHAHPDNSRLVPVSEPAQPPRPSHNHSNTRSSPTVDVSLANSKDETSGSSDVLDADSPRSTDSCPASATSLDHREEVEEKHLHHIDHSLESFPSESAFLDDPGMLQPLDDRVTAPEFVDQSCNYLLLQLDEPSVLAWWDWP